MATTRISPKELKNFEQKVQRTASKFPAEVVRIRHSFGEDWDGDPAIFFRIVLVNDVRNYELLSAITGRVRSALRHDLGLNESGYIPYFYFRSKAEEDKLKDPEWE